MRQVFFISSFALYVLVTLAYLGFLIFPKKGLLQVARKVAWVALGIQSAYLVFMLASAELHFTSLPQVYLLSSWLLALVYLSYAIKFKLKAVGAAVFVGVIIFYLLSFFKQAPFDHASMLQSSSWAGVHIVLSFFSFSVLLLAFILAVLFFVQEKQIKQKRITRLFTRLPSLEVMDHLHSKALLLGFVLLTFAIISGALWAHQVKALLFYQDPRQLWTLIAWLVYALFLQGRYTAKWRGRRGMLLSLLGFAIIIFTFVGVSHR